MPPSTLVTMPPRYRLFPQDSAAAAELSRACGVGPAVAQVLLNRGYGDAERARDFLDPRLAGLTAPDGMADRALAADRLARAVRANERIAVFGDYDVDGTTSAVILAGILRDAGGDVTTLVANRFQGGYGFSAEALDRCRATGATLFVTCDCGSADHERMAAARMAGVDVIVVDHHLVPPEPLPAFAFLNPHRPDCAYPYKGLASAGLALVLGAAVRAVRKDHGGQQDLRPWLDLVALGTIADVAPLDGDNRRLVRAGLARIMAPDARPGLVALRDLAGVRGTTMGAIDVAFRLTPRLNAAGRLGDPAVSVALLEARTAPEARGHAAKLETLNEERRALTHKAVAEATAQIRDAYGDTPPTHGVVVAHADWHRGVVGIVAARLVDELHVPVIAIACDDSLGHGSARGPRSFALHAALGRCRHELEGFGGHDAAAGLTVRPDRIDALRAAFADVTAGVAGMAGTAAASAAAVDVALPSADAELGEGAYALPSVQDLGRLEPLGEGNPEPVFAVRGARIERASIVGGSHLKLALRVGAAQVAGFGYALSGRRAEAAGSVDILAAVRPDGWRGGSALELRVLDFWAN